MSSVLRVFKFHNYLNQTAKYLINSHVIERNFGLCKFQQALPLGSIKICERKYSAQHLQPRDDLGNSQFLTRGLESDLQFLDSLIKRGSFIKKKIIEDMLNRVALEKNVTPSQALFILNCCGSSVILESKSVRKKLASQLWKTFQDKGWSLDISHYNALLQIFIENESDFSPLDFLAMLKEKNIKPNRVTYSRLIEKFCQEGHIDDANKILEHMKNDGMGINEYIFCSLILGNSRANDLEEIGGILEIMKKSGIDISSDTYAALIQAYGEHEKFDEIDRILSEGEKEGTLNENSLLEIVYFLADRSHPAVIEKVIHSLEEKRVNLSAGLVKQASSRLLCSGHDELAFKLFKMQPRQESQNYVGNFFPKLIAASNIDLFKVVDYCEDLRKSGWNIISFELALESYITEGNTESALALLRVMKERGNTIKEHYIYPLLVNVAQEKNRERTFQLFEEICHLEIHLSVDFYSSYLLPSLDVSNNTNDIDSVFSRIVSCDEVNSYVAYNGFVEFILKNFDMELAAKFVTHHRRSIVPYMAPTISDAYVKSLQSEETAEILYYLLPLEIRQQKDFSADVEHRYAGFRNFFSNTIAGLRKINMFDTHMPSLLKAMESRGVYLVPNFVENLTKEFGESINPDIQETLQNLSDSSLMSASTRTTYHEPSLRQQIKESESSGEVDGNLNMRLLARLLNDYKIEAAEEIIQKLNSNNITLTPSIQVMLLRTYVDLEKYEEAENIYNNLLETHSDVQIHPSIITKIAKMFVDTERVEDGIKCILINSPEDEKWPTDQVPNYDSIYYRNTIFQLLNGIADKSDISTLKRMQEALLSRKYAPTVWVLAPLVQYHVRKNNIDEALSCLKKIYEENRVTPGLRDLLLACIKEEDTDRIQQILDMSNDIHGELNTLHDLVFGFIEAGKVVQAERVVQTSGFRVREEKLHEQCKFYVRTNRIEQLRHLIKITKHVFGIKKEELYGYLLDAYISVDDEESSLSVWTTMQEESLNPDENFLIKLGNYLRSKGSDVPFAIPSQKQKLDDKKTSQSSDSISEAVRTGNLNRINNFLDQLKRSGETISFSLMSSIIETFLNRGQVSRASELTKEMFENNRYPHINVLKKLLRKLEDDGDIATLELFGKCMNEEIKAMCALGSHLSTAIVKRGGAKELLEKTEKYLQENVDLDYMRLTRKSLQFVLEKHPELYPEVTNLIEIARKNESTRAQKFLQMATGKLYEHNFINENYEEAEKIYNEYMKDKNIMLIRSITSHCFKEKDVEKIEKLLEVMNRKPEGRENVKGHIYSTYIDILGKEKKFDEALNVIKKSLESINLEHYRTISLIDLRKKMEGQNLTFPYEIPNKRRGNDIHSDVGGSSSSDSEDEK